MIIKKTASAIDLINSPVDIRKPHDYQYEAIEELDNYFELDEPQNKNQNGLLVMPTGSGKTLTTCYWLLKNSGAVSRGYKVLWLVHRQELIKQTNKTMRQLSPLLKDSGLKKIKIIPVSGSRYHYRITQASGSDIIVCGIQSAASRKGMKHLKGVLGKQGANKLVVVIDEAHHATAISYESVLRKITKINPKRILLGLTATPYRMSDFELKKLYEMFNANFNKQQHIGTPKGFIYEVSMQDLILKGVLAKPKYVPVETMINGEVEFLLSEKDEEELMRFKDLTEEIKAHIANTASRNKVIAEEYRDHKEKYGKTLVFAVSQEHAKNLAESFKIAGIDDCDYCISGEDGSQDTITDFKDNAFSVLINVQMLTEGSDIPDVKTVFLTRPTRSDGLLMQMIGRALRGPAVGGKDIAYIVDFHDNWERFNIWLNPKDILDTQLPPGWNNIPDEIVEEIKKQDVMEDGVIEEEITEIETAENEVTEETSNEDDMIYEEIYMRIYAAMRSNIVLKVKAEVFPCGWFNVIDENGYEDKVLVFEQQKIGYDSIANDIKHIIKESTIDVGTIRDIVIKYFDIEEGLPICSDIKMIVNTIQFLERMPDYFAFEKQDHLNPRLINKQVLNLNKEEAEYWLKEYYESHPDIRSIYKTFFVFKTTVQNAAENIDTPKEVLSIDEREEFNIQSEYYDLDMLYAEVINSELVKKYFPQINIPPISWSHRPLRSRYGQCKMIDRDNNIYSISINKLLCSPKVPSEVIKYVIYHELLHANKLWNHDIQFREMEWRYPLSDEYDRFLDKLFMDYQIDEIVPPRGYAHIFSDQDVTKAETSTLINNILNELLQKKFIDQDNETEWLKTRFDNEAKLRKSFGIFYKFKTHILCLKKDACNEEN